MKRRRMRVLGIMSGTSLDGVDYAGCTIDDHLVRLDHLWRAPFPAALRRRLQAAAAGQASSWETAQLHHDLGRFYAVAAANHVRPWRPQLAGLHGQTIFHGPPPAAPATCQIGEPVYLAAALGVPVINNFRAADLAAGGQGAPLATVFHLRAFAVGGRHVCVQNLGGIGNVTSLDARRAGRAPRVIAFDTGPGNMLLDLAVQRFSGGRRRYDRDGRGAARGRVQEALVEAWLAHPFLRRPPPKSTGREEFGEAFLEPWLERAAADGVSRDDFLASLVELTARTVALNYRLHLPAPPELVILGGGGAENPVLCSALGRALLNVGIETTLLSSRDLGWPSQAIEPGAFALLAWLRWHGQPGHLPATTGARRAVLCGQVTEWAPARAGGRQAGGRRGVPPAQSLR